VKLRESVEWLLHSAATLAQLAPDESASAAQLADYYGVPAPYLAKQLQELVRAGLLHATPGPRGGYRLARPADDITILELVEAIDGVAAPYRCREIRQQGRGSLRPEDCQQTCILASTMAAAHQAFRDSLAAVTLADILATLPSTAPARTRRLLAHPG
jgi:Rrf2 family protein